MNFTQCIKHGGISHFSPDYSYIATSKGNELYIFDVDNLTLLLQYNFNEGINYIEWSCDSKFILIGIFKKSYCEVKSLEKPDHNCKIDEGMAGMLSIHWAPDGRKLLSVCDCNIKLTIWSLIDKSISYINNPKYSDKGISFSFNGLFMALAERKEWHDYIGIYFTKDWTLVHHFQSESVDLQDIIWLKDNTSILIIDSSIEGRIYVYSHEGKLMATFIPFESMTSFSLSMIKVTNHKRMIAFYVNDHSTIKIYDTIVWKLMMSISHKTIDNKVIRVLKEKEEELKVKHNQISKYVEYNDLTIIDIFSRLTSNNNQGITQVEWNYDLMLLAYRNDSYPNVLLIWNMEKIELHTALIHLRSIKDFKWSANDNTLIILTENNPKVYIFSLNKSTIVDIPFYKESITPNKIDWSSNGNYILLSDKSFFIIGKLKKESYNEQFDYNAFI